MRLSVLSSSQAALVAALVVSLSSVGCGGSTPTPAAPSHSHIEGVLKPVEVSDQDFAVSLHRVLRDGSRSADRLNLLVGVVRRQLAHAGQRFVAGHEERAMSSVVGALYLVRPGESRKEMIDAKGADALAGAIERVSSRGDEGRALSLMRMRAAALEPASPARAQLDEHLTALDRWMKDTRTGGVIARLGADERAKVARALFEPTDEALEDAAAAINAWITQAIQYNEDFRRNGMRPTREEAMEAARALESGGATMAALFLRYGDAAGALKHLDESNAQRVIQPAFYARIRSAATNEGNRARDFQLLAAAFAHQDPDESDPERDLDGELIQAALFGCALEAYRADPTSFDSAMLLSRSLIQYGMPEAVPLVLGEAVQAAPTAPVVGASMEALLAAIVESAAMEDLDAASRTFAAAAPLVALADRPNMRGQIEPSSARIRFVMSSIEVRAGHIDAARDLLRKAAEAEPSVSAFTTLAVLERQAGDSKAALAAVERALRAPDARMALLDIAEAHLIAFEIHRDGKAGERAKAPLDAALSAVLAGRQTRDAADRVRAERLLGRVLEGYGDDNGASRAFERALQYAAIDRPTLGAAMLDAIGRALVRKDLKAARAALKHGLEGDVDQNDLVYGGLWVALLERELHAPSDGTVDQALKVANKKSWTAKLSAWMNGKLTDSDLSTAAQSESQRVEAAFYTAMARKVAGDPSAEQKLKAVATSPVIDLLEVQIARELVAPEVRADLPVGVKLP